MITAVLSQNNQSRSLCKWTDNNLITDFLRQISFVRETYNQYDTQLTCLCCPLLLELN